METYRDFLNRINSFEKKEMFLGDGYFMSSPSISQKVDKNNRFQPFYGDTIVFNLDDATKRKLSWIVDKLYGAVPECFCERLVSDTFHMTLHDLSNSPSLEMVAAEVFTNELSVIKKAKQIHTRRIRMRSKYIFNMVNTSLVLGLYPISDEEYAKLMELYLMFDDIKKLEYPLTPHITLAYYNVEGFDVNSAKKLEDVVRELNANDMEIELDVVCHITLGSYAVEETEEIVARIKEMAKNTQCFDIKFSDLDHFGNMVRFLRPEISKELLELHQHFDSDYANGYTGWMPHATLYRHSEPREIELSKQIADKIEVVKNARIVGIELGEFFPPKKIIRVLFEK